MMNKQMRDILSKIENLRAEAKSLKEQKDFDGAKAKLAEIDELQKEYEVEKALFESDQAQVPDEQANTEKAKKVDGFAIIQKLLRGHKLDDAEKALVYGDDGEGTDNDENLLVPEDVDTAIRELRKTYVSAKDLLTVIKTSSMVGGFNFESGTPAGLDSMDDGDDVPTGGEPTFARKSFAIKLFGKLIAIGNVLKGAERAGLMAYINRWFVRNAIITENSSIFAELKNGKTVKQLADWKALKSSINKDLDPSTLINGVIVTNQTGFDKLDSSLDGAGRPILTDDLANPTVKKFNGLPIKVFPDAQLANDESGKSPIFYGDLGAGAYFIEKDRLNFAVSEHALFGKNSTALRVIEGFDVIQADEDAYVYGLLA